MSPLSRKEHDSIWIKATLFLEPAPSCRLRWDRTPGEGPLSPGGAVFFTPPQAQVVAMGKAVNTKDEKHREKIDKGKLRQMESDQI